MGLSEMSKQVLTYPNLTREERARMHPCKKCKCVMMSADPSAALRASIPSSGYVELPDEPRSGKITPSSTSNSSPSPRGSKSETTNGGTSSLEDEAIEEAVPIVRSTLPSPEPRPIIELSHNGYKDRDMVDSNGLKAKPLQQPDVDNDSCLIKCVYFTQQCCECTIV